MPRCLGHLSFNSLDSVHFFLFLGRPKDTMLQLTLAERQAIFLPHARALCGFPAIESPLWTLVCTPATGPTTTTSWLQASKLIPNAIVPLPSGRKAHAKEDYYFTWLLDSRARTSEIDSGFAHCEL
jgi:hypothetical protein